jgi:hypothetical protein
MPGMSTSRMTASKLSRDAAASAAWPVATASTL